jgi:acetyl esterase
MPLHPQASRFLQQYGALRWKPIEQGTPTDFRRMARARVKEAGEIVSVAAVENRSIPGPGGPIPVRCYRPSAGRGLPALVFFHGGGWVGGDLDTHDALCREITNAAECMVIAVDYRLAPEHKYPAAVDDALAATSWAQSNAAELQIDGRRIAVGGDSAGGNLAAVVSLMMRDRRLPAPCLQVLLYPILDFDFTTASYQEFGEGYWFTRAGMQWFCRHYLSNADDARQPYAAPFQASDLRGLPAALVLTAEFDVLRDEAETYAARLQAAGVSIELTRYNGMLHGFIRQLEEFDSARTAVAQIAAALKRAYASVG